MKKVLGDIAYDKAIEAGLMKEGDTVSITIGLPSTSNTYVKGRKRYSLFRPG